MILGVNIISGKASAESVKEAEGLGGALSLSAGDSRGRVP